MSVRKAQHGMLDSEKRTFTALLNDSDGDDDKDVVQLLGWGVPPLQMDCHDCTMVVIFPRAAKAGGAVNHKEMVEAPLSKARRIFDMANNHLSDDILDRLEHIKSDEPVLMEYYQADIRQRFLEVLRDSSLQVSQFSSLDRDEDFLKIYLPLDGDVIAYMAEELGYQMPFADPVYEGVAPHGPYPGRQAMRNDDGRKVPAKTRFRGVDRHLFEPFRRIDAIRLVEFWLDNWVSLDEMERQGVVTSYFPCPNSTQINDIHREALSCGKWLSPHFAEATLLLRPYLGEQLAFYFKFVAHLAQSMLVLGVIGVIFFVGQFTFLADNQLGPFRTALCVISSIWAASLLQVFARHTSRTKQFWGVEDKEAFEQANPDWDPNRTGERAKIFVNVATLLYVLVYMCGILALLMWQFNLPTDSFLASISSMLLTVVIKGGSVLWTNIAPALVKSENHRTESEEEAKLSGLLAGVKLFVANFPFFSSCFLTTYLQANCAESFADAAAKTWAGFNQSLVDAGTLEALQEYSFERRGKVCLTGCVPKDYTTAKEYSRTNCDIDIQANLTTYFAFAVVTELILLMLPIVLSYWEIHKEYQKLKSKDGSDSEEGPSQTSATYSFLQWEAKKFEYAFGSWGGDKTNDFLDMAINYSIVACWGVLYPPMATIAVIALFILLRLRVYRMLYVTQRPLPRASAGLGIWKDIFQCINVVAVACNVGLAAQFFYPMRLASLGSQLLLFVILEHVILLLQATVKFLISDSPRDVTDIRYYNEFVKKHVAETVQQRPKAPATASVGHINVSLNPDNVSSASESEYSVM